MMKYLIDSNSFIAPHRGYAPIDVAVSLWAKIKSLADKGVICSLDTVRKELYANDDELKDWLIANVQKDFFIPFESEETNEKLLGILSWANMHRVYSQKAKEKFIKMDKADIFLAAFVSTHAEEYTVVSFEHSNHFGSSEIKLPDVCSRFGAKCITLQNMFRELKETF